MSATAVERGAAAVARAQETAPRPSGAPVIDFRGVSKQYPSGDTGLEQVTFSVEREEFVFLVGSTGSGKSTVMRLLIKELEPTAGTIRVAGRDLHDIRRKRVPYYRRNVGVVFQDFKLLPNRTVYGNVAYALQVTGGTRREIREKVPDILRLTGLSTKLHNYPDQLSGGEQQRVSIARALVGGPKLVLADEPTGNLDTETGDTVLNLLSELPRERGAATIIVTHDARVARYADRVLSMRDGKLTQPDLETEAALEE